MHERQPANHSLIVRRDQLKAYRLIINSHVKLWSNLTHQDVDLGSSSCRHPIFYNGLHLYSLGLVQKKVLTVKVEMTKGFLGRPSVHWVHNV